VQDLLAEEEDEEVESEFENRESEELDPAIESIDGIEHTDSYHLQLQRNKEEAITNAVGKEEQDSESVASEMLVAEQSTASDVVGQAMAKAVERTATPPV
jgi:hypothetical protein